MRALYAVIPLVLCGCPMMPTPGAKLHEAAQELNVNARFGRMDMASEFVAPKEREAWGARHKFWGSRVRIADTETSGARILSEKEAEVVVRIAWFRPDEQDVRVTTVKQKWSDVSGDWRLTGEARLEGDAGLLNDAQEIAPQPASSTQGQGLAPMAPKRTHFPTVRITEDEPD
jgi:hypothetical protein